MGLAIYIMDNLPLPSGSIFCSVSTHERHKKHTYRHIHYNNPHSLNLS